MEKIIVPLLVVCFLLSLKYYKRFWIILFVILRKCWFPIFTAFLAVYIFSGTAQGKNIVNEIDFTRSGHRKFTTMLAMFLWSYNCFKLSKTALDLHGLYTVCDKRESLAKTINRVVPALLGFLPFIVSTSVFVSVKETPDLKVIILLISFTWLFLIYLLLKQNRTLRIGKIVINTQALNILSLYVFMVSKFLFKPITGLINKSFNRDEQKTTEWKVEKYDYKEHWRASMNGEHVLNWTAHAILYTCIGIWPIYFAKVFGPIGLFCIAMSFFVIVGTIFIYLKESTGFPMFPVFITAVIIFTSISDNNKSGVMKINQNDPREELNINFNSWLKNRISNNKDTIQVTLVAAEGGGLRSAYWTYAVLRKLQAEYQEFYKHLYAISSVSGGSMGSALFCSEQLTGVSQHLSKAPIINDDNLSPMIAALFFRELVQSILPMDIECLDRSIVMNQTFETHWNKKYPQQPVWTNDFLDLWKQDPNLPALFVNSIHVESGANALFSSLRFDSMEIESLDMMHHLQNRLSLSEVVGLSSRFPYVQPAAKFEFENESVWGHLADGGYFENSGVATMFQIYLKLRELADVMKKKGQLGEVKFSILSITNGEGMRNSQSGKFLQEMNTPINTLLNSWYTRGYSYAHIARSTMSRINPNDQYFEVKLNRKNNSIPLGWFLSAASREEIVRQSENLDNNAEYKRFKEFAF